ncbi:hypothetical protein J2Z28_001271 [Paenibacillus xylanexedens]|uniref:Uncharacterized protein n=1 Tax=Paenibacillus xylanexedens TaxID=528191 RepID=A0ABS4RP60_PAEXY|nr:hypothetical protein [Paenibacillus xylanexedens]
MTLHNRERGVAIAKYSEYNSKQSSTLWGYFVWRS